MTSPVPGLAERIGYVRGRVVNACLRADRNPEAVTLIGASKTQPPETVAAAFEAGLQDLGENRVQEAKAKVLDLRARGMEPQWHLIGSLQRNKVTAAVGLFDVIHSVDSEPLAREIAARSHGSIRLLLEVNVAGEATKHGVAPAEAPAIAERIGRMHHVELIGLMTVAPDAHDAEDVRPVFRTLRELRDAIGLSELSMGMSGDFEVAIEEGATLVRVGRAIFGERSI